MFVQTTEAYLVHVPLPSMVRDRYVDNEDKRGVKFLVGTTDRSRWDGTHTAII